MRLLAKMVFKGKDEILEEKRESKKIELSQACHEEIIKIFEVDIEGEKYGFSYDMEAQTNMQETYHMFQNNAINEITWSARHNQDKIRITLNKSDFEKVYYSGIKHKQSLIGKLKDVLEPLVDSAESESELNQISWDMKSPKDVDLSINKTLDRSIQNLQISQEMSDMALMEFVNMIMGGEMNNEE